MPATVSADYCRASLAALSPRQQLAFVGSCVLRFCSALSVLEMVGSSRTERELIGLVQEASVLVRKHADGEVDADGDESTQLRERINIALGALADDGDAIIEFAAIASLYALNFCRSKDLSDAGDCSMQLCNAADHLAVEDLMAGRELMVGDIPTDDHPIVLRERRAHELALQQLALILNDMSLQPFWDWANLTTIGN